MIKVLVARLLGDAPCRVRYCESDGSICTSELRAEELRARIDRMRASIGSALN